MPPAERPWPDAVDSTGLLLLAVVMIGLPLAGYVFLYCDYRAYLRSLRTALVLVRGYARNLPDWVLKETPPCLVALGLKHGCTREEVLEAYRKKVKQMHPDAGGNRRDFARLQEHFEQAMSLVDPA